ncbi:MAG TPA: ATP-binding protein [Gaiellaceae bacterium]
MSSGASARRPDSGLVARRRTRLALATMLGLLLAITAAGLFTTYRLYRSAEDRYVKEAFPLRLVSRDLLVQMLDEETGVRGYVISADPASLQPYAGARTRFAADLAELQRLTVRRPEIAGQVQRTGRLAHSVDAYLRRQIVLVRSGRAGQLRAQSHVLGGKARFDRFRASAAALGNHADQIVAEAEREQRHTFWRALAFVLLLAAGAAAIGAALLAQLPGRLHDLYRREQEARQRAERGDRASRSLEHVQEAVVLVDADGTVRYWNRAAASNLGVSEEAALGRPVAALLPELAGVEASLARAGTAQVPVQRDGADRWFAVSESRFADGRVLVLRNVTDEQRLERARAEFLATASHELRTPLAAVYGAVRTLTRVDRPADADMDRRLLTMIEEESERLRGIVEQILVASQLDRGRLTLDRKTCELRQLGESVLASARVRAADKYTFVLDAPGDVHVECDPARLRQVLANLVDNALKYAPDGGSIRLRVSEPNGHARIEVEDEGIGIAPEAQQRVFEKFYRVDPDMHTGVGGSGLGLFISRELVEQMGGRMSLRSMPGVGSTFVIDLPREAHP